MDITKSIGDDFWTVCIMTDNHIPHKNYDFPVTSSVEEILDQWIDDLDIDGQWIMTSLDGLTEYDVDQRIEDIGESIPGEKIVNLRVKQVIPERKYASIFTLDDGKSENKFVDLDQKLRSSISSRGMFEYGNNIASLYSSFRDIGIRHNEVIYKTCLLPVLLSDGTTRTIRLPESGTVLEVKNRLMDFESGGFSLKFLGRVIDLQEPIRGLLCLGKCVEVFRPTITVRLVDRSVRSSMSVEHMKYGNLVSDLRLKGELPLEDLEHISFRCRGCGRRIWSDEECFQRIISDCCRVQSLDLEVEEMMEHEGTISETNDTAKYIQRFNEYLVQDKLKDLRAESSRSLWREIKEQFSENGLDYNADVEGHERFLRRFNELENEIKVLMINVETLKIEKNESAKEIGKLRTKCMESIDEINMLKVKNKNLGEENKTLDDRSDKLGNKEMKMVEENKKLSDNNRKLDNENKKLGDKIEKLFEEQKKLKEEKKTLYDEKMKMVEETKMVYKNKTLHEEQKLDEQKKHLHDEKMKVVSKNKTLVDKNTCLEEDNKNLGNKIKKQFEEQKKLEEENKRLYNEKMEVVEKNKTLVDKNKGLEEENKDLGNKIKKQFEEQKKLEEENKRLYNEKMEVVGVNMKLDDEYKRLDAKSKNLVEKNKNLDEEMERLHDEKMEVVEENKKLSDKNKKLYNSNKKLVNSKKKLVEEKNELLNENENYSSQTDTPQGAIGGFFSSQQFLPTTFSLQPESASILIHGWGTPHMYVKLELPIPVTTVSIREELNKLWFWDPARVLLYRRIGIDKNDGVKCVHICGDSDEWQWGELAKYCDTAGCLVHHQDVDRDWFNDVEILPENLSVSVWGNNRNVITAEIYEDPLVFMSIHVHNGYHHGNDFVIELYDKSDEVSEKSLEIAISEQLKVDWNALSLSMWSGIHRYTRRRCFHVCDEDGIFLDGDDEDAEYVDIRDRSCKRSDLRSVACRPLFSDFRIVTDRRVVIVANCDDD